MHERFLEVRGDAYARGFAQGQALAATMQSHIDALDDVLARIGVSDPQAYLSSLVRNTDFEASLDVHAPHLLTEIDGLAAGAGLARERVYALQLMDEEWAYRQTHRPGGKALEKCSSFAVRDGTRTWIGQNMDLGGYTDGFQRLVRHVGDPGRPDALVFTTAGVVALLGVNGAGVGVCVNSLPQLPSRSSGIPVAFMIRRLLEARSASEAADLCQCLPHATNQHYLIADAAAIYSFECSAAGVTPYISPHPGRVVHTNHPLAGAADPWPTREVNSTARLRSLQDRLFEGAPSEEIFRAALSAFDDPANPVCRMRANDDGGVISFTTGAMISALPAAGEVQSLVSFGPPAERVFHPFTLPMHAT